MDYTVMDNVRTAVSDLNALFYEDMAATGQSFEMAFTANDTCCIVEFMGTNIWSSEEHEGITVEEIKHEMVEEIKGIIETLEKIKPCLYVA